jgi:hypothetical protein
MDDVAVVGGRRPNWRSRPAGGESWLAASVPKLVGWQGQGQGQGRTGQERQRRAGTLLPTTESCSRCRLRGHLSRQAADVEALPRTCGRRRLAAKHGVHRRPPSPTVAGHYFLADADREVIRRFLAPSRAHGSGSGACRWQPPAIQADRQSAGRQGEQTAMAASSQQPAASSQQTDSRQSAPAGSNTERQVSLQWQLHQEPKDQRPCPRWPLGRRASARALIPVEQS